MRAVIIIGSAKEKGNTSSLCGSAAEALTDNSVDVRVIRPYDMDIAHCTNCRGCDDTGICVIDDDMSMIYEELEKSDIVILGTPVHFSGFSSIMKQVIDRLQCMWTHPEERNAVMTVIADGGSPEPVFKNIISEGKAVCNSLGMRWVDGVCVKSTDAGIYDDASKQMYELGSRLSKTVQ